MRRLKIILIFVCLLFASNLFASQAYVLEINGAISPATQDYFKRSLQTAIKDHANLIILKLNTPGGLKTAMRGIDEVADNLPQLLKKIDGHAINVLGHPETMQTKNLKLNYLTSDWRYDFLAFITNPNIAYILMLIAIYGLFFELSNPGLVVPGVVGLISLLLVLYAFQLMPLNYAGLFLLLIGVCFMLFEIFVSSFGIIGIGGMIAFIIGSIMLFDIQDPNYSLNWSLIVIMSLLTIAFFSMLIVLSIRSHKTKVITGAEGLIGSTGVVINISDNKIIIRVQGEIWEAHSTKQLTIGETVRVEKTRGLLLYVKPTKEE